MARGAKIAIYLGLSFALLSTLFSAVLLYGVCNSEGTCSFSDWQIFVPSILQVILAIVGFICAPKFLKTSWATPLLPICGFALALFGIFAQSSHFYIIFFSGVSGALLSFFAILCYGWPILLGCLILRKVNKPKS